VAIALLVLVFFLPFRWWALAAAAGFGAMEGIGLWRADDAYPPLTHVIRRYVPRWVAFTAICGFTGAAGGVWLGFARPARLFGLLALLGWFTTHFDVAYDERRERGTGQEREALAAAAASRREGRDREIGMRRQAACSQSVPRRPHDRGRGCDG
jgi:hypothetical protein